MCLNGTRRGSKQKTKCEYAREVLRKEKHALSGAANLLDEIAEEDVKEGILDEEIEGDIDKKLKNKLQEAKQRVRETHRQLKKAEDFATSIDDAWKRFSSAIHETKNIAAAWERKDSGDRRVLFSHWVEEVHNVLNGNRGRSGRRNRQRSSG